MMHAKHFIKSDHIHLTKSKGLANSGLSEFVALGMLQHAKNLKSFMNKQAQKKWEIENVHLINNKTLGVIGFGDIGATCGKVAK